MTSQAIRTISKVIIRNTYVLVNLYRFDTAPTSDDWQATLAIHGVIPCILLLWHNLSRQCADYL
jgi:hypothetical protein